MKVRLLTYTPEPEKVVAAAAKLCYSSSGIDELLNGLTEEKSKEFVEMLATLGHESPTEHVSFTFAIEGVSRALLAQITRHRIGSFSVQSQRYVSKDNFDFILPPEIEKDEESKEAFLLAMEEQAKQYKKITNILQEAHVKKLMQEGMEEKSAIKVAKKKAIEDARFVLPNACDTKMIVTMNTRSLNNFFHHRCCDRAQWEIRELADEMLKLVYGVAPGLFKKSGPPCVGGNCKEGKMSCGKMLEMRDKYAKLKSEAVDI